MKQNKPNKILNILYPVISIIIILVVWTICYITMGNDYVMPSVSQTLKTALEIILKQDFYVALAHTFLRTLISCFVSLLLGIILACICRISSVAKGIIKPIISFLRSLPTMAIVLILLCWTTPRTAPIIVSMLVIFPTFFSITLTSLENIDANYQKVNYIYKIPLKRQVLHMYLPLSMPYVLSQVGATFSLNLKVMVAGEVLAHTFQSLGGLMYESSIYFDTIMLLAYTLITVLLSLICEFLFNLAFKPLFRWRND